MQLTIDLFIENNKEFNDIYKKYFCLNWTDRFHPEKNAYWSDKPLSKYNVKYSFINKFTHMPVVIMGNIENFGVDLENKIGELKSDKEYENISFLKSHLQKCIRRKKANKSIQTAWHLLELDPIQFLRRLCIIYVEDVSFHESFNTVVWLLVAVSSKVIDLQLNHKEWLLGIVYTLAKCVHKDIYNYDKNEKFNFKNIYTDVTCKKNEYINLFLSIFLRMGYGGMKSDIILYKDSCLSLFQRFNNDKYTIWKKFYYKKFSTINYIVRPLLTSEWELSAIDFHCYPKILYYLQERIEEKYELEYTTNELKKLIWDNRSKTNTRRKFKNNKLSHNSIEIPDNEWYKINGLLKSMSKYIIYKYS